MVPTLKTREDYVKFIEVLYFGAIQAGNYEAVLEYFAPCATLIGYAGDAAPRVLCRHPGQGQGSLDAFMAAAGEFDLEYCDFVHHVDTEVMRVASYFSLTMRPRVAGAGPTRRMKNCNFFQFEGGRLSNVVAYFCNPGDASS